MTLSNAVNGFIHAILVLINLILAVFGLLEHWLRTQMYHAGIGPEGQSVVLILVAVLFFVSAFRFLGGAIRILIVIFLILFVAHLVGGLRV